MLKSVQNTVSRNLQNTIGWTSKMQILVIESDDWGSVRMSSKKAYLNLRDKGFKVDTCPYNRLDRLETENDMLALFDLLEGIKDYQGNPLKLTANYLMANPDFQKIEGEAFENYHYIGLEDSYEKYNGNSKVLDLARIGVENKMFTPQLHGREHLHPLMWLQALQEKDEETLAAFKEEVWGHPSSYFKNSKRDFSSAFHVINNEETAFATQALFEAVAMFQKEFGYISESFIAPRYIWNRDMEECLSKVDVRYLQGKILQFQPIPNREEKLKTKYNYLGKRNSFNQIYLPRNVFFEPAQNPRFNWKEDALNRIRIAFRWKKPAIISMHRLNFMGGLEEQNRTDNLMLLGQLIQQVQNEFPEVLFMSSNELGKLIEYGE